MQIADKNWLTQVNTILQENINNPHFNNINLAQVLYISERTLHRKIKKITNLTPLQYSRMYKLQQAKILLHQGPFKTVKEVALAVGFIDTAYFSQRYEEIFKRRPITILKYRIWQE